MKFTLILFIFYIITTNALDSCAVFPKEIYDSDQYVFAPVEYSVLNHHGVSIPVHKTVYLNQKKTLVGAIDYCAVMNTKKDGAFYSASLSFDVKYHTTDSAELCFYEFYDNEVDTIQLVLTQTPYACITANVFGGVLSYQVKDILRYMLTRPVGTLSLFSIKLPSSCSFGTIGLDVSSVDLELAIPAIPTPPPMPQTPSSTGNDYQHLFPGSTFYHACTIPDEELQNNYTNPPSKCYGRDAYVYAPLETNPMGPCIKVYTDGMPSEGAMHHTHANNNVSLPGETPYVSHKYCWVVVSTRLGSGTNTPTPPIDAWNWNLYNQQREQLRFLQWARSFAPSARMTVYSHDRDSIQTQLNSFQELIDAWATAAGHELIPVQHNISVLHDSWLVVCKPGEEIPGVCSESTLFQGLPAPHRPLPVCQMAMMYQPILGFTLFNNISECTCEGNVFLTTFINEWGESRFIHRDGEDGYRKCMWRNYGYEDNYHFYENLEDPQSIWRQCAAKWKDPFTNETVPAVGFLLDGAFQLAYNFTSCMPISTGLSAFTPQVATPYTTLPPEELAIFSYGAECETRFNSTQQQLDDCLMRREYKSLDPNGAVFNTAYHLNTTFPQNGLTGVEMYHQGNLAFKNNTGPVKFVVYHTGPGGLLNPNSDPDYIRSFGAQVIEGRYYHSHFYGVDNPYDYCIRELLVDITNGIVPNTTTI